MTLLYQCQCTVKSYFTHLTEKRGGEERHQSFCPSAGSHKTWRGGGNKNPKPNPIMRSEKKAGLWCSGAIWLLWVLITYMQSSDFPQHALIIQTASSNSVACVCQRILWKAFWHVKKRWRKREKKNYAHHLLILDSLDTGMQLQRVKVCQGQKPLEKVCGLSHGFSQVFVTCAGDFSRTCLKECSCIK